MRLRVSAVSRRLTTQQLNRLAGFKEVIKEEDEDSDLGRADEDGSPVPRSMSQ